MIPDLGEHVLEDHAAVDAVVDAYHAVVGKIFAVGAIGVDPLGFSLVHVFALGGDQDADGRTVAQGPAFSGADDHGLGGLAGISGEGHAVKIHGAFNVTDAQEVLHQVIADRAAGLDTGE